MKKDKRKKGSFIFLLIRSYIAFTLAVLAVIGGLYGIISFEISRKFQIPNDQLLNRYENALISQQYDKFPVQKIFGMTGGMQVLDEDTRVIYSFGADDMALRYTTEELLCMQEYDLNIYYEITEYSGEDGNKQILISKSKIKENTQESVFVSEGFVILTPNYKVITNMMNLPMEQLTEKEYEYLTNSSAKEYSIRKYPFVNSEGENCTAIFRYHNSNEEDYARILNIMQNIWFLFIPLYILIVAVFIFLLNKKVKRPLTILNERIENFSSDDYKVRNSYSGPNEFVEIGDNFEQLSGRLRKSEMERKKADADKQKMLADISHDLKTPITVIQGYSKAISDGIIPKDKQEQYLRTIYAKSTGLTELINTFYEYSKMQHPSFELVREDVDICEYFREYLAEKYNEISLNQFELQVDIPEDKTICSIDRLQIKRVFDNLLSNSMKHNQKGCTLFCEVTVLRTTVKIVIGDDGVGIPENLVPNIFGAFVVGDESRNNRQGTGLGLAIVQKIIKMHDGTIQLKYPPREGLSTEFVIHLNHL